MGNVQVELRRLRNWFLAWFTLEAVAGSVAAAWVIDGMRHDAALRFATLGIGAQATLAGGVITSMVLLLLALLVFDALLDLSPWARMVLLAIGWLTLGSALLNLLLLPGASALVGSVMGSRGGYAAAITAASLVANAANLVFWGWVIHTLQFKAAVRDAFCRPARA